MLNTFETLVDRPPMSIAPEPRPMPRGGGGTGFTLRQSGSRPLAFTGRQLGGLNGYHLGTPLWHELNLYQTDDGRYVADIRVFSKAQGTQDQFHVSVLDSVEEALLFFEGYDARQDVQADFDLADPALAPAELLVRAAALKYRLAEAVSQYRAVVANFLQQLNQAA